MNIQIRFQTKHGIEEGTVTPAELQVLASNYDIKILECRFGQNFVEQAAAAARYPEYIEFSSSSDSDDDELPVEESEKPNFMDFLNHCEEIDTFVFEYQTIRSTEIDDIVVFIQNNPHLRKITFATDLISEPAKTVLFNSIEKTKIIEVQFVPPQDLAKIQATEKRRSHLLMRRAYADFNQLLRLSERIKHVSTADQKVIDEISKQNRNHQVAKRVDGLQFACLDAIRRHAVEVPSYYPPLLLRLEPESSAYPAKP